MIDPEIAKIANDRIFIEIGEQNDKVRSEIGRIKAEAAAKGLMGGSLIRRVLRPCAKIPSKIGLNLPGKLYFGLSLRLEFHTHLNWQMN